MHAIHIDRKCWFSTVHHWLFNVCLPGIRKCADCFPLEPSAPLYFPHRLLLETPRFRSLEDALARSQPGTQGQLCILEPSLASAAQNCADGLTCIPLPQFQPTTTNATSPQDGSSVPFMLSNLSGVAPLLGAGFCTPRPAGTTFGVFNFLAAAGAAQPLAYFPLTGGDLSSATIPEVDGEALGDAVLVWQPDPQFEMVPVCRRVGGAVVLCFVCVYVGACVLARLRLRYTCHFVVKHIANLHSRS
jgi:hypothetical protein